MVLLDQLWDDIVAGPQPKRGLKHLRKVHTKPFTTEDGGGEGSGVKFQRSQSLPASPGSPESPGTPKASKRANVSRSVFNPGSNQATKTIGSELYSGETKSQHR